MLNRSAIVDCASSAIAPPTTAVVITYSAFSASPVRKPPHGPMAERANEYAPPVCGSAGDISAML